MLAWEWFFVHLHGHFASARDMENVEYFPCALGSVWGFPRFGKPRFFV